MKLNKRPEREKLQEGILSELAQKSHESLGRVYVEEEDEYRTCFERYRDRILHSKSFRRLKHKTQVFLSPGGDHYRTRLTHTLEVNQIARSMARALGLNEDLTEAIALGHDLGHTPFGHCGERALNRLYPHGFRHNEQSLRVVEYLELRKDKPYVGLNLSYEVRDGILNHSGGHPAYTLEGNLIRYADRIAYLNHDFDDAIRAGLLLEEDIPKEIRAVLGEKSHLRIDRMIRDLVEISSKEGEILMSDEVYEATIALREFMFERLYLQSEAKGEDDKAERLIAYLYNYFNSHPDELPEEYQSSELTEAVKDYIAGMSDRYAVKRFTEIFVPAFWQ